MNEGTIPQLENRIHLLEGLVVSLLRLVGNATNDSRLMTHADEVHALIEAMRADNPMLINR